ncbi:MAG TPA: T9SS type A sorting domain-containing protein, partial [Bacteroidales bacterium]|nr:T9SS type A sorting domain-containing protein [Bacteroidales bacterium]
DENPSSIVFNNTGVNEVTLTVERYGCTDSYFLTIDVPVVTCGNDKKILICHIPPGNPENPQTICISPEALPTHLAHGDCVGSCIYIKKIDIANNEKHNNVITDEIFVAYPNPFNTNTVVSFTVHQETLTKLQVFDYTGRVVSTIFNDITVADKLYKVEFNSQNLQQGIYLGVLQTINETRVIKLSIIR